MSAPPSETPPAPSPWALEHAREIDAGHRNLPAGHAEVELVTDPWSVWCWGFEPVRRALEHRFPSVTFRPLVGGMFERLPDPDEMGFDVQRFFAVVQRTTGMPLRLDASRRDPPQSTYPACVHVAAMRLVRPELGDAYLRRLREAVYLDARNVSRPEVAADVAASLRVPEDEFLEALASGEPEREFRETLGLLQAQGLHAYPTLVLRTRERTARVEGFQSLPALLGILERLGVDLEEAEPPTVLDLVPAGERVATREIAEVLGVSFERAHESLLGLKRDGRLLRERHPWGDTWSLAETG